MWQRGCLFHRMSGKQSCRAVQRLEGHGLAKVTGEQRTCHQCDLRLSEVHSGHVLGFGASDVLALCVCEALRAVC